MKVVNILLNLFPVASLWLAQALYIKTQGKSIKYIHRPFDIQGH